MKSADKKITLLMLTYGRPALVLRQILFLSSYHYHLVIADGSRNPIFHTTDHQFNNLKVTYFHEPGEGTYVSRLIRAIEFCQSEFVLLMDDSDIYVPSSIGLLVEKMKEKEGWIFGGQVSVLHKTIQGARVVDWGQWSSNLHLEEEQAGERIGRILKEQRTANLYYTIFQAEFMRKLSKIFQEFLLSGDNNYLYRNLEIIIASAMVHESKFTKIEIPFQLRCDTEEFTIEEFRTDRNEVDIFNYKDYLFILRFFERYLQSDANRVRTIGLIDKALLEMYRDNKVSPTKAYLVYKLIAEKKIKNFAKASAYMLVSFLSPMLLHRFILGGRILERSRIGDTGFSPISYYELNEEEFSFEVARDLNYAVGLWTAYPFGIETNEFMRFWDRGDLNKSTQS